MKLVKIEKLVTYKLFYIIIIITIIYIIYNWFNKTTEETIVQLTDRWIYNVTVKHDPQAIADMFCKDGNLVGTVSQVKRKGTDIKKYFDYFAKLPDIQVLSKKYIISQVKKNVFVNTAFIEWTWKGLPAPVTARMTFLFRGNCIFQLHSSMLPDLNQALIEISNMN
jgi:hypothetical protein